MRSSADIYEGMEAAIRKDEQEPLLEGFHDMESTQQPFEVVDNNTPTEELPPRRLPPSLQEQIKACLTVLEEIQSRITEEDKPRIHNY